MDLNVEAADGHFAVTGKPYLDVAVESTWPYYIDKVSPFVGSFGAQLRGVGFCCSAIAKRSL